MNVGPGRNYLLIISALLLAADIAATADPSAGRAILQPAQERKTAPDFVLKDGSGKTISLRKYRGKVVLVDFWATWCTGCKKEIPWFSEFEKAYHAKGLAVIGISMDEGGWTAVKPYLAETHIPYPMLLGDNRTAKQYEIEGLPDTFLIDRKGRVAAAYRQMLVNKEDVEANLKAMLSER
jgi:peroxiredoxin